MLLSSFAFLVRNSDCIQRNDSLEIIAAMFTYLLCAVTFVALCCHVSEIATCSRPRLTRTDDIFASMGVEIIFSSGGPRGFFQEGVKSGEI